LVCLGAEAYPFPVTYRRDYDSLSGSTNNLLKGDSLDQFLLKTQGKPWGEVPLPSLKQEERSVLLAKLHLVESQHL
jgi:hypothetical protein